MRRRVAVVALVALFAGALAGCPAKKDADANANADASADANADASTSTSTSSEGHAIVVAGCLSCHTEHMLAQQRLTAAQWQKVVTKMVGWGANVEPAEVAPLVAYLSASYSLDAGGYSPEMISATDALAEIAPLPDPFPAGDAERGKPIYVDKCSGCHGVDALGHIGVALIDRPFLYRAADFAKTVRKGRGKMLPLALSDTELADVLAHLRRLKNAAP